MLKIATILIFILAWMPIRAEKSRQDKGGLAPVARNPHVEWVEPGLLSVSFTCPAGIRIGGADMIRISPVFKPEGRAEKAFAPVLYMSRSGKKFYLRREEFSDGANEGAHIMIPQNISSEDYVYTDTIATGTVAGGVLEFSYFFEDCCSSNLLMRDSVRVKAASTEVHHVLPLPVLVNRLPIASDNVVFVRPEKEEVKNRSEEVELHFHYRLNDSELVPDYMDNLKRLSRLDSVCAPVMTNSRDYTVTSVSVTGYASPDGGTDYNRSLSERRASSFSRYFSGRYSLHPEMTHTTGAGEDWQTLLTMVEADSLMPHALRVAEIIREVPLADGRKEQIKELSGGEAYRYMLKNFFPRLRRMVLLMKYTVRSFDGDEACRMIATRPQDLDCRELFEAASRMNAGKSLKGGGREEYGVEYDIAAGLYPDDVPTQLNAASAALIRYDLEAAYRYLMRIRDDERSWNNIGVYHWMCGDEAEARRWFEKAALVLPDVAGRNLEMLDSLKNY